MVKETELQNDKETEEEEKVAFFKNMNDKNMA